MSCGQIVGVISYCLVPRHYISSRTMTVRKAKKSANRNRRAGKAARQDAEIADLKARLDTALAIINAQAAQIKTLTERIVQLENE